MSQQTTPQGEAQGAFLSAWDAKVRNYAQFFQIHAQSAREDISALTTSPLTNWRDVTQRQDRYQKVDSLQLRRQLGEITSEEVSEVNRVLGGNPLTGYQFIRGNKEPALLVAVHKLELMLYVGAGGALGAYGRFVKGYNNLWLLAPVLPMMTFYLAMKARQPTTLLDNAYR